MIASTSLLSPQQSRQLVIQDWEPQSSFVQLTCQMSRARSRASARRLHLDVSLQCSAVALLVADLKKGKDIPGRWWSVGIFSHTSGSDSRYVTSSTPALASFRRPSKAASNATGVSRCAIERNRVVLSALVSSANR